MRLKVSLFIFFIFTTVAFTQVGIGTTSPATSSVLDISAIDKGVLIPRIDIIDLSSSYPIIDPEKSLLVWNTDLSNGGGNEGFYYWNGAQWVKFAIEKARVFSDKFNSDDIIINANNPISFDTTVVNQGINYTNTYFEVPNTGYYRVNFNLIVEKIGPGNSNGIYAFYLSKTQNPSGKIDGTFVRTEIPNQFSVSSVFLSKIIYLEAQDTVYLMSQRRSNILSESSFNIEFIND